MISFLKIQKCVQFAHEFNQRQQQQQTRLC